jgi:uncharacterized protein HemX
MNEPIVKEKAKKVFYFFIFFFLVLALLGFFLYFMQIKSETNLFASFTKRLTSIENQTSSLVSPSNKESTFEEKDFTLAKIAHLIDLADLVLVTKNDPLLSARLLQLAKQNADRYPELLELRAALAKDLETLQNLSISNRNDLIQSLDSLNQAIAKLPEVSPEKTAMETKPLATPVTLGEKMQNAGRQILDKTLIIQPAHSEGPLLYPEQLANLKLNLQTKLLTAEWAVISGDENIYLSSLTTLNTWLGKYFSFNKNELPAILEKIAQLEKAKISASPVVLLSAQIIAKTSNVSQRIEPRNNASNYLRSAKLS